MKKIAIFKYFAKRYYFLEEFKKDIGNQHEQQGIFKIKRDEIEIHIINLNDLNGNKIDVSVYNNIWLHLSDINEFTSKTVNYKIENTEKFSGGSKGLFPYKYIGDQDILDIKLDLIPEFIIEVKKQHELLVNNKDNPNQKNFLNKLFD